MNGAVRILAGTVPPGGASCLFPVVQELRRRPNVEVQLVGHSHAADVFREHGVEFVDPTQGSAGRVTDPAVRKLVSRFEPDLIVTGVFGPAHGGLDHYLLRAAQDQRIPSLGILDAWMNYAKRFADPVSAAPLAYLPDRLAVMDEQTVAELVAEGIPRERLCVTGHPFLSVVRRRGEDHGSSLRIRDALHVEPGERVLAFFSEPIRWGVQEGLVDAVGYDEFIAFGLLEAALTRTAERSLLVVKEHPKRASLEVADRIRHTRVVRNCELSMLDLVTAADVVVGMSSTVLVYAYLMGRKVLVIQPDLRTERDCNMLTRRGILPNLRTAAEIERALEAPSDADLKTLRAVRRASGWENRPDVRAADCALEMCAAAMA